MDFSNDIPFIEGRLLIGGHIIESGFERKPVMSPCGPKNAQGDYSVVEIGRTPEVTPEKFSEAADAAIRAWARGQGAWPTARMEDRIHAVSRFRDALLRQRELIAKLLMWEIGKPWADSLAEFDRTIQYIDDTIEAVKQLDRDSARIQFASGIMAQIRRMPLGVTLCLGPYNYPFNETFTTLVPALILGNCIVAKPPRFGSLLWDTLLEPFRDAFPPGVVNVANGAGREIIAPCIHSGKIDVLAFIGSSAVANKIKLAHPHPHRFRSVLSLDAKNPAVVLNDADLDNAVTECIRGTLSFNGQRCTALKMLFVQRGIAREFTERFVAKVDALKAGLPWEQGVSITPLPEPAKPATLTAMIQEAVKAGARLENPAQGGQILGSLMRPAVVSRVPLDSRLALEEQFGPVVPIAEFDDVAEFERYVTDSHYGMQASIFAKDPAQVGALIDALSNQVCRINLNAQCQRGPDVFPFTGRKDSAEGTLSVTDALRQFSIRAMVAAKQDAAGRTLMRGVLEGDQSRFLSTHILL